MPNAPDLETRKRMAVAVASRNVMGDQTLSDETAEMILAGVVTYDAATDMLSLTDDNA